MTHRAFVDAFLRAIERDEIVGREGDWYAPDAVLVEFPNKLAPQGATRDRAAIRMAGERGRAIVAKQSYEITGWLEQGDRVAFEAVFRATFQVDLPDLPKGSPMTANFGVFLLFKEGRIARHHTYDCFQPW